MTVTAFIMINVANESNRNVLAELEKFDEVTEAYIIFGAFDILVKVVCKTPEDLSEFVIDRIRTINGVGDTLTNVCASC